MQTITLNLTGVEFEMGFLRQVQGIDKYWDVVCVLNIATDVTNLTIRSINSFFSKRDLTDLYEYLKKHIERSVIDPNHESLTYVNTELGIQVSALTGDVEMVDNKNIGGFSIRIMLNVGNEVREGTSVYAGIESYVEVTEVELFLQKVVRFINTD